MSYCRFGTSDVYMYGSGEAIICCSCSLRPREHPFNPYNDVMFRTRSKAIGHLKEHQKAGDKVSEAAITRLQKEIREQGDKY